MQTIRLRSGEDRRFNSGHPWVYSNELAEIPQDLAPGAPVELQSAAGKFLARGYSNSHSLIAFRALSRDPQERDPTSFDGILKRLKNAAQLRSFLGCGFASHRLCFGEADFLPGLVIDRYLLSSSPPLQVFVVQSHTAGIDRILPQFPDVLEALVQEESHHNLASFIPWEQTALVLRNDAAVRKLEGLKEEDPKILKPVLDYKLENAKIFVNSVCPSAHQSRVPFYVNLVSGQKTGFFLDQVFNIQLAAKILASQRHTVSEVRILDLCSYVGHWGAQLGNFVQRNLKKKARVCAVDASSEALLFSKQNCESLEVECEIFKADVLKDLGSLDSQSFDIVICDPPAFIKGRKFLPQGKHAYLQLNTQVFRLIKEGGTVVSCSCSALLDEEDFLKILAKASQRNQRIAQWVGRGFQSPDHPVLAEFPEGRYLKTWIGVGQRCHQSPLS